MNVLRRRRKTYQIEPNNQEQDEGLLTRRTIMMPLNPAKIGLISSKIVKGTLLCVLLVMLTQIVSCTPSDQVPDQIAMAAEHRALPSEGDAWPLQSIQDTPQIKILQVQCEKSHMRVNIEFDRPFYGMIFSKGHYSDPHCVHLQPGSGHLSATFDIYLNACGMTSSANNNGAYGPAPSGTFVENTIIIQYDPLVQEVWDQARKLRCTWYDFYEKSVTFRPFQVDMLHAVTANFLGDNLQCWMQIQVGKGPWASEVSGIVKIGQTMTMVLAIKDDENKFDMLVRNCVAHDGKRAPIQLVDQYGCVTRPKIMSRFHKIKNFGASASVVSYAYFQAFKFPDSMNVHFQCVIQVCRYQCPEPKCGGEDVYGLAGPVGDPRIPHAAYSENKENIEGAQSIQKPNVQMPPPGMFNKPHPLGGPLPQPSHIMLPPPPRGPHPHHGHHMPAYPNIKREGTLVDNDEEEDDEEEVMNENENKLSNDKVHGNDKSNENPSYAALGGRPRSVDFDKAERLMKEQQGQGMRPKRSLNKDNQEYQFFTVSHVINRRSAEASGNVKDVSGLTRVIQVVAPGDVAFSLSGSNSTSESVIVESSSGYDGICMSVSSFVFGLVMLLLLLVVTSLVAAFLFVRVRAIHRKTNVFGVGVGYDNPEYLKHSININ